MPAKPGRPRKPTALKKLHNAGRRPINEDEPVGPAIDAPPPTDGNIVSLTETREKITKTSKGDIVAVEAPDHVKGVARAKWNEIAPSLANSKVLTVWDFPALETYVTAYETYVQAQEAINELQKKVIGLGGLPAQALLDKTPNNMKIMSALVTLRNAAARDVHKFGAALGLDPVSRASLQVEKEDDLDDLKEFA